MERMNVALKKKREQEVALAELIRVRKALNPPTGVYSPGTTGAIKEYEVVIDLLSKGYDVYRSCSPNSSCDLVATKGPRTIRLEVAIGYYAGKDGRYTYNRHQGSSDFFDIIAVVLHDKIVYLAKGEATFTETQL